MSGESFPVVPAGSGRRRSLRSYLLLGAGLTVLASATIAPAYGNAVGDPVLNPVTNANEIIAEILPEGVITDQGNFILLITTVGAEFTDPEDPGEIVKIESVNTDPDNGNVVSVVLEDGRVLPVVQDISGLLGDPPDPAANLDLTPGAGDTNFFSRIDRGSGGSNGRTGALFVPATSGGNGATGPTQNYTIPAGHGDIETVSANTPGISVVSIGGNGGRGGDGYAGASGRSGGTGGAGGPVTVVSNVPQITTSGSGSHGIFAQSRSGRGGQGGSGFIFSGGGSGGAGNDGGTVHVTSEGDITTLGDGAHGIFGQSLGGGAGSGGISIGLFGSGGGGAEGGSGGTVTVINHGNVVTAGAYSHGVFAQSVGGNGGSAGASFGLAAFGDNGEGGGNGGMATAVLRDSGSIITLGEGSIGLFAQSTGGGGGQGGTTGGALAMGSQGGSGGNGGQANATVDAGGYIQTQGDGAYAVAAQSIGGGGGMAGVAGGAVALGGGGSGGGSGGNIVVSMDGELRTLGEDASAIFAQSIGGGGGSARGTGGLFALGGTGGGGGAGGSVTVTTGSTAAMHTSGQGAHGIFAQSIGGGGGSGSSGGGVVSLGGSGAGGGNGAAVTVTHGGSILTEGNLARGIFAQSVGGGGGSGGHSGGLVSLGGSGGTASTGGNVTVTNNGIVETLGDNASAIQAQSIGGGGGDGGTTGGAFLTIGGGGGGGGGSGLVTVNHTGDLQTFGDDSHGIFAQSVGGGGGNGGASGSISAFAGVALGGAGGAGGAGGNVVANLTASGGVNPSITTHGDRSRGLYVQSVGGGGGNGGFAVQVSGGYAVAAGFAIGGSGGSGGAGGTVTVNGHVDITTFGQSAEGIMAQSVGGGGGSGGFAGAFAFSGGETAAGAFSLALGGSGGTGGAGGTVILNSGGQIITEGDFSTGLVAQSIGGGGGSGGFAISVAGSGAGAGSGAVAAGVGGSGGDGGAGGTVNATFDGEIYTIGDDAGGALIQSVGGGGGNGGFAISGAASISGSGGVGVGVGVGGSGGGGAAGGTVTGSIAGPVYTEGERSTGVIIQSIGGGGGNGGFSVAGSIGGGGSFGGAISVGVGGSGGGGGAGGTVNASAGEIHTLGHDSGGFLAQSVGGGGGNGGFNVSGAIGGGGTFGGAGAIGIGGAGGDGGAGGNVTASVSGVVTTQGDRSAAVIAQSLGGGGGNGGFNVSAGIGAAGSYGGSLNIGVGGAGGGGGHAGNVTLSALDIFTSGDQSGGFVAQSVGGGGGSGGFNVAGGIGIGGTAGGAISVGVGGSGGGGGNAGNVTGTVTGDVVTQGDQSVAITAQSIGGGGGSGGFAVSGGIAGSGGGAAAINVGVGGSGGGGGHSGAVMLSVTGQTDTSGEQSSGIVAQSVGGGGGSGGFAITGGIAIAKGGAGTVGIAVGGSGGDGGNSGNVTLTVNSGAADPANTLAVVTRGDGASGAVAQSVGGGGGNGGFTVTGGISAAKSVAGNIGVGIGGGGGGGGDGGTVIANITGGVATWGDDASAVFVQSLGGGGGNGGFNVSGGIAGAKTASGNIMVGIGGFGGDGGHGGAVSGSVSGDVFTAGANSSGVTYQSLGGGGGNGGFNVTGGVSFAASGGFTGNLGIGVGGFGGAGGDASTVNAAITGDIYTQGSQSYGALLQSLGGGGGNGAFNVTGGISAAKDASGVFGVGIGGFGGGGGDAAAVTGTLAGNVVTEGDGAYGVSLQSLGGGGGNGGFNVTGGISVSVSDNPSIVAGIGIGGFGGGGGDAGTVTGTITGDYQTSGNNAHGVLAQSVGGSGGNGGFNVTGALAFGTGTAGTGAIGIGGFGGAGGHGDDVTLVRAGLTRTHGLNSSGIIAQSIGGGGGNGGFNVAGGVSATTNDNAGSFGFGLGGFGGGGGNAGDVVASVTGSVIATGAEPGKVVTETVETVDANGETQSETLERLSRENGSHGVLAQSLGGGGGNGAFNVTGQVSVTRPGANDMAARAFAFGVGGFGGDGGDAGTVNLTIAGPGTERALIQSTGDDRFAVGAQSIGGGGGAGAFNISGGISSNGQIVAGVGGFGGDGGLGGNVTANVDADLFASGVSARGLLVQSVGGGGGFGGFNVAGGVSFDPNSTDSSLVAGLGGFGGAGNASGDVTAVHSGLIFVTGQLANGALVQSVAGGGGSGGWNVAANVLVGSNEADSNPARGYAFSVGVGGTGGDGADAGDVSFTSTGDIIINGAFVSSPGPDGDPLEGVEYSGFARGVLVQSIGGGGGAGGFNFAGAGTPSGNPIVVGVGGSGGSGGHGGDVSLIRGFVDAGSVNEIAAPGLVRTFGDHSTAILVQSVGGGGGDAGINIAAAGVVRGTSEDNPVAALIAVGGSGAGAGSGGDVSVRHAGTIITDGEQSAGLIAQSIGGGGGNANFNVGFGLLRNANALNLAVGGATGAAGRGGDVTVSHDGAIVTVGDNAMALVAQSIGGGGGNTAMSMATGILTRNALSISIGRLGGTGGEGGDVSVDANGLFDTSGDLSTAIFAQSIGGGGGVSGSTSVGGSATSGSGDSTRSGQVAVAVGLEGGAGATAGHVAVTAAGQVTTRGLDAHGIHAQSIGGGGGTGGTVMNIVFRTTVSATVGVGGAGGTGGLGGDITVHSDALISTSGRGANGLLAQSIGGGGGTGGYAANLGVQVGGDANPESSPSVVVGVNVGGAGGTGNDGGDVDVSHAGMIFTTGELAYGIRAQSIGGGGGDGGMVINARVHGPGDSHSADINVGGSGGVGGIGGDVTVDNEGLIVTGGRGAAGISANSIGGGGGNGALVLDGVFGVSPGGRTQRFVVNVGGFGGSGGTGGDVTVTNRQGAGEYSGMILTSGDDAYGIFAQSLGGGGGNGGSVLTMTGVVSGGDYSLTAGLNIGGFGGSGNTGGTVDVLNSGLIQTEGSGAHGILAQSIGGGGGNGGMVLAGNILIAKSVAPMFSLGGFGGSGGDGGDVTVTNSGQIFTSGANAHGIQAQSIGGGGGNANVAITAATEPGSLIVGNGFNALLGATFANGSGGTGGHVTVNHTGSITVTGTGSQAIRAESINGGGGSLVMDFTGITSLPGRPDPLNLILPDLPSGGQPGDPLIAARLGADEATDTNAGKVTINTTGQIASTGDHGAGSAIQAVGGGGGSALLIARLTSEALAGDAVPSDTGIASSVDTLVELGGSNGIGNSGADIDNIHNGAIITTGLNAPGSIIQSIGGGGGRATAALLAPAGTNLGPVRGILGGVNGTGEAGGDIAHTHNGELITIGDLSAGLILQSIGGGGGSAAFLVDGAGADGAVTGVIIGGEGGSDQDAGSILADLNGGIFTLGNSAPGLLAQSIGGGGGELRLSGFSSGELLLGGLGGSQGDGAGITISNTGAISTAGTGAHGVVLQSIGGGGGAVFGAPDVTLTLSDDNVGDGGDISFVQNGNIVTTGAGAYGVILQSLGGGGGWVDGVFAGSAGGNGVGGLIHVALSGAVLATGDDAVAVLLQSQGGTGAGGDITADFTGALRGGDGQGAGLIIDGGDQNTVNTSGSISAVSGRAIITTSGDDTIHNDGLVAGNIDLGTGNNAFNNNAGATFVAFNRINLRSQADLSGTILAGAAASGAPGSGTFTNDGTFLMGLSAPRVPIDLAAGAVHGNLDDAGDPATNVLYGARVINTVELDGDFVQTENGLMRFDVAFGPYASDRVNVTGDALVNGSGEVILTWLENNDRVTLFATGGAGTDNGLSIDSTLAITYGIVADSAGIHLTLDTDFGQDFLNRNQRSLGGHMDSAVLSGGSSGVGRLLALLGNMQAGQEDAYQAVFNELNPEPHIAPLHGQIALARSFASDLFSCDTPGTAPDEQCVWTRAEMSGSRSAGDGEQFDTETDTVGFRGGLQRPLNERWSLAAGIGYESISGIRIDDNRARSEGQAVQFGLGLQRHTPEGLVLAGALSGGWQWLNSSRVVNVFDVGIGESSPDSGYARLDLSASQYLGAGNVFAIPSLGLAATVQRNSSFEETGLAGLGVRGLSETRAIAELTPGLTLGAIFRPDERTSGVLTFSAQSVINSTGRIASPYMLLGANPSADPAIIGTAMDRQFWRLGTDFTISGDDRLSLRLRYSGEYGDRTESHRAGFELRARF